MDCKTWIFLEGCCGSRFSVEFKVTGAQSARKAWSTSANPKKQNWNSVATQ